MKILYICTHNRCRSILSEAITNHLGSNLLTAQSAGSQPVGEVHPLSLKYLNAKKIPTAQLKSESWQEKSTFEPNVVITVCDSAAGEACPLWMGKHLKVHWGLPDPSKLDGSEEEKEKAFYSVMETIEQRVKAMLELAKTSPTREEIAEFFNEKSA